MAINFTEEVYVFGVPDVVAYSLLPLERLCMTHAPDSALWITSMLNGRHGSSSYHYDGGAWDADLVPSPPIPVWQTIRDGLRAELDDDWDVIYEDPGGGNEHLHAELERRQWLRERMAEEQQRLLRRIRGQPG